jgi:hypothetical protein
MPDRCARAKGSPLLDEAFDSLSLTRRAVEGHGASIALQ